MYVTVLRMEGVQCRCLVENVADAVGLLPGGCRLFDAICWVCCLLVCYRWCPQCADDNTTVFSQVKFIFSSDVMVLIKLDAYNVGLKMTKSGDY